jgi:hypothetical protein
MAAVAPSQNSMLALGGGRDWHCTETSVTRLLSENPNVPVATLLADSDLQLTLRYEHPVLIDYIAEDDHLSEILKWSLTREYASVDNSFRLARAAVGILSSPSKALDERLLDKPIFVETLTNFQTSQSETDLQLCGHFQRIIETYVRYTNGGFLENFPDLCPYLIEHVDVVAFKVLLVRLLTDFDEAFAEEDLDEIALILAECVRAPNGYFVVTAMRDIIKGRPSLMPIFQNDEVLTALLTAAVEPSNVVQQSLYRAELFRVIDMIARSCPIAPALIRSFEPRYTFDVSAIDCGTVSALRIFRNGLPLLLPRMFEEPSITVLNQLLLERLKELGVQQLRQIIDDLNLIDRLIQAWPKAVANGHLTVLACYLDSRTSVHPRLQSAEWKTFVETNLAQRLKDRTFQSVQADAAPELGFAKKGLVPMASFGGVSAGKKDIGALLSFASENQRKVEGAQRPTGSEKGVVGTTSSFSGTSLLPGIGAKKGLSHMGASFTIPTLYQAEPPNTALIC